MGTTLTAPRPVDRLEPPVRGSRAAAWAALRDGAVAGLVGGGAAVAVTAWVVHAVTLIPSL